MSVSEFLNVTKNEPNIVPTAVKIINAIANTVDEFIFDRYPVSVNTASNSLIVTYLSSFRLHSSYKHSKVIIESIEIRIQI